MFANVQNEKRLLSATSNEVFLEMLPKIRKILRYDLRNASGRVRDEMMSECIVNAFCAFAQLVKRGKTALAYPTPLARFALMQVREGRRVGCPFNSRDVMSRHAQRRHGFTVLPLQERTGKGTWEELVMEDRRCGPAEVVACRLDFRAWLRQLNQKVRAIAISLASGEGTAETARHVGVTPARISQLRRELSQSWEQFAIDAPTEL